AGDPGVLAHVRVRDPARSEPMGRPATVPPRDGALPRRGEEVIRPFFERPPLAVAKPRLLLIAYHFAPAQTAGALRWAKFSQYAAERGWALDVVTLHPSSVCMRDMGRLATLPAGIRVYGIPDPTLWVEGVENRLWRAFR